MKPLLSTLERQSAPGQLELQPRSACPASDHAGKRHRELHHLLFELPGGGVIGVEVKAAAAVDQRDARHLTWLREALGERFAHGLVLHTGPGLFELGDRITAAPISALWA